MATAAPTRVLLVSALLVMATVLVYWPTINFPFIDFDDDHYVTENPHVRRGMAPESIRWAFGSVAIQNWHPLTWISHMADVEIFGLDAGKHHLVSVLLHASNAVLLFLGLASMTGAVWRSGFVAALFALHPLHVESVAWVAERKDVLSGTFWMLTLLAYARYARHPGRWRYLLVALPLGLGLMAKPMLVTLPFVLLLLDYWPLERHKASRGPSAFAPASLRSLVAEKIPLFLLSLASCAVTLFAQTKGGAVAGSDVLPFGPRAANAVVSYTSYLLDMVWPEDLAIYYPHAGTSPAGWKLAGAFMLLAGVSFLFVRLSARYRYLVVGWLWFLVALVPVAGLVQVGGQARADRYTYIPLVGLFIMVAWGVPEVFSRFRWIRRWLPAVGIAALAALSVGTRVQIRNWRSSEALFRHALSVTVDNWMAHTNLGKALLREGRADEAIPHFREAQRIKPGNAITLANLGAALGRAGQTDEAALLLKAAVRADPSYENGWYNLGILLLQRNEPVEAVAAFREVIRLEPGSHWGRYYLGLALFADRKAEEAMAQYRAALAIWPDSAESNTALGVALAHKGQMDEAIVRFREAYRLDPGNPLTRQNLEAALQERAKR